MELSLKGTQMIKRICIVFLTLILLFSSGNSVLACDETQINTYVTQILFGDTASSKISDEKVEMLLKALSLCSGQSDRNVKENIKKVPGNPDWSKLEIKNKTHLFKCFHNTWEYEFTGAKKQQENRKEILQNTVNEIFDFGLFNNWFGRKRGKCNSFAAVLYYSHILSDYLAADPTETETKINGKEVPFYSGKATVELNGNKPSFTKAQKNRTESFIEFSPLDSQGRAGIAFGNIGTDTLTAVGDRENMVGIKPSGWNQNKYGGFVTSKPPYLFNRCHLLAHQLGGIEKENNLITGTRYLNEAMIPYENQVAEYIKKTGNHVLYRATPIFESDNKLASGIQLEAYSVEDAGKGVSFNVYCYNVQPGVKLNYMNGKNEKSDDIFGKKDVLPFVVDHPDKENPDLIFEMDKHMKVLFTNPKNQEEYKEMCDKIDSVSNKARGITFPPNTAKYYID